MPHDAPATPQAQAPCRWRRRAALITGATALLAVAAGCASMQQLHADVASYGDWPAGRVAGTYAFDRLPSQQQRSDDAQQLEAAAAAALAKAGFQPAAAGQQPALLVQLGARDTRTVYVPWDDPLWWRGGFGSWRHGPWAHPRWSLGLRWESPRYEREVALLLRDRASGQPLYEARAASEGYTRSDAALLQAMFSAALADFPKANGQVHRVSVPLPN